MCKEMRPALFLIIGLCLAEAQVGPIVGTQHVTVSQDGMAAATAAMTTTSAGRAVPLGRVLATDSHGNATVWKQNRAQRIDSSPQSNLHTTSSIVSPSTAITIHVPADQPTIQGAINAANNGDTVLVSDGTYNENINFNGKAVTVKSVHGASLTTINGGGLGTAVLFISGETASSVLNGFTISNGSAGFQAPNYGEGGGIAVSNSSPTITNNTIRSNNACNGAGIGIGFGGPLIQGNVISNNVQVGCSGGIGGGGISVRGASGGTRIIGNTISNNTMPSGGGGISLFAAGGPTIQNNTIQGNNGGQTGGGIVIYNDASPQILQNLFYRNTATSGGAIYWVIPVSTPGLFLLNNTIAENSSGDGSAIYDGGFDTNMTIVNNLMIGKSGQAAYFCQQFNGTTVPAVFSYNDVFAAGAAGISGNCTFATGTNGNISIDPNFIKVLANNFHLQSGSPAIDAGTNTVSLLTKDLDGFPRIQNGIADIGAYEFFPTSVSLQPSSLTFGIQLIGTKSTAQPVQVTNTGTMPLFLGMTISGEFLESTNCPARLAAAATCSVNVTFKPAGTGVRSGTLLFADNASASPQDVALTGTGQGFPVVSLSPLSLAFGTQVLGTSSAAKKVTLKNTGTTSLSINSITTSPDFTIAATTCGSSLAPQVSCTFSVVFKPVGVGTRLGTLNIDDNASGSPHTVSLSGVASAVQLSPTVLSFSPQIVGTLSTGHTMTVSNRGPTTLNFTAIGITGNNAADFIIGAQTCGTTLAASTSCTVTVKFQPSLIGAESASLSFSDNGGASPQIVNMSGTGTVVSLSRTNMTFAAQSVGTTSSPQSVTLTNKEATTLHINNIFLTGTNPNDFLISFDSCPPDLVGNSNCTVSVEFRPTAVGTRTASLAFSDNGGASPQTVKLTGTGQ
jgi:parallel beta-helix repeat protein